MAFSKPMLPDNGLSAALEYKLMQQWETGYNNGIEVCIAGLEMLLDSGRIPPESIPVLKDIIAGFKREIR